MTCATNVCRGSWNVLGLVLGEIREITKDISDKDAPFLKQPKIQD